MAGPAKLELFEPTTPKWLIKSTKRDTRMNIKKSQFYPRPISSQRKIEFTSRTDYASEVNFVSGLAVGLSRERRYLHERNVGNWH